MSKKSILLLSVSLSALILFNSCSVPGFMKPSKQVTGPVNAKERARKNVEEGRGVSLKKALSGKRGNTNYEFSTSNPLWRSTLEVLDFLPLSTVDYSGGIIITDWYNDSQNSKESLKITVRFLSNEVRSDSVKVIVHQRNCSTTNNCSTQVLNSTIKKELVSSILTKAALLKKESENKK